MSARPTRPVTTEEIEAFHRDGAVLLPGVLAPEWVALVADGLEECYAERSSRSSEAVIRGATVRVDHLLASRSESLSKFAAESPVRQRPPRPDRHPATRHRRVFELGGFAGVAVRLGICL